MSFRRAMLKSYGRERLVGPTSSPARTKGQTTVKGLLLLMSVAAPLLAQPTLTFDCPVTKVHIGDTVQCEAIYSNPSGTNIAAFQFKWDMDLGGAGAPTTPLINKRLTCGQTSPRICLLYGLAQDGKFNNDSIQDGAVIRLAFVPTALPMTLEWTDMLGASPLGHASTIIPPTPVVFRMSADVDGSGTVDISDLSMVVDMAAGLVPGTANGDLNGDNQWTIIDVVLVLVELIAVTGV